MTASGSLFQVQVPGTEKHATGFPAWTWRGRWSNAALELHSGPDVGAGWCAQQSLLTAKRSLEGSKAPSRRNQIYILKTCGCHRDGQLETNTAFSAGSNTGTTKHRNQHKPRVLLVGEAV